eukprot:gene7985-12450_t
MSMDTTAVENDLLFKDSVLRIIIGDYATSVCLFDIAFDDWNGPITTTASALVKSLYQFSQSLKGGDINKILLSGTDSFSQDKKPRRMKSIFQEHQGGTRSPTSPNIMISTPTVQRHSISKDNQGAYLITHFGEIVYVGIFIVIEDDIIEYTKKVGQEIVEEFLKEYKEILSDEKFKIEMNNLKEGKETTLTDEEIANKFSNFKEVLLNSKIIE